MAEQVEAEEGQEQSGEPIGLLEIMRNLWLRSLEGNGSRAAQEARAVGNVEQEMIEQCEGRVALRAEILEGCNGELKGLCVLAGEELPREILEQIDARKILCDGVWETYG